MGQPPEENKPEEPKDEAPAQPATPVDPGTTAPDAGSEAAPAAESAGTGSAAQQTGDTTPDEGANAASAAVGGAGTDEAAGGAAAAVPGVPSVVAPMLLTFNDFDAIPPNFASLSVLTTAANGAKSEEHYGWDPANDAHVRLANNKFADLRSQGHIMSVLDKGATSVKANASVASELQSVAGFRFTAMKTLSPG